MPGINLTRDEARERAALLEVDSYQVDIDLTGDEKVFAVSSRIRFSARPGATSFLDFISPSVDEVTLNGTRLDTTDIFDGTRIQLADLAADNELVVRGSGAYMHTGEGLHRFIDPVDGAVYLYTQFEVIDARRMFPCFDQPDLKATFAFTVSAPDHWQIISGAPTPEPEHRTGNADAVATWAFPATQRISTYITALCAGPYHGVRTDYRGIPMGVFCRASLAEYLDADEIFEITQQGFDHFERMFDRAYPFEKYDQIFVPEFNAGAMENAGAVTILEDYVFRSKVTDAAYERRAETMLHELAHMWFGDLVTMRWWDDLWLNESFATFVSIDCQARVTRWPHAWTTFANLEKTWAYRQDQMPSTHPIAADIRDIEDVEVNFDGITYGKGAAVLKQLVAWVGHDRFFAGVQQYFRSHAWGNTELSDLLAALESVSDRDLSDWAKEWLETAGINTLRPEFSVDAVGRFTSFSIVQTAPDDHPILRSHRLAVGLYSRTNDRLVRVKRVELDVVGQRTYVADLVGEVQPDLVLVNDDDLTYAKVRLDETSLGTLIEGIDTFDEPLPRAICWTAAWDMTRDAEMRMRDFTELALAGVASESDISVVQTVLGQVVAGLQSFTDPSSREEQLTNAAERLGQLLLAADAGSDHQLGFARYFATLARTPQQLDRLGRLLDGDAELDGLQVDTELRWSFLRRLVATGQRGTEAIAAELERDHPAAGQRHAAAARAMVPTADAKAEAWRLAVESDELPNAVLSATVAGYAIPDHRELHRAHVKRYFEVIEDVWGLRTNETAQTIVIGMYPASLNEQATVDLTDEYLATRQPTPALRRLLVEGRDSVLRALRAQVRDASAH